MNSRKKITLALVSLVLIVAAVAVAITSVLAAQTQTVSTETITVSYHAVQVDATVSAQYGLYKSTRSSGTFSNYGTIVGSMTDMTTTGASTGSKTITFVDGGGTPTEGNSLKKVGDIVFNGNQDTLIFSYKFVNNDATDKINLSLTPTTSGSSNITFKYAVGTTMPAYNTTNWTSSFPTGKQVGAGSGTTLNAYVMAFVTNLEINATLKIALNWTLSAV